MKGSETRLVAYMQGSSKRFVIPVYQRNYDWKTENCKQLFDDLIRVVHGGRKSHFFGSIVSVFNPDGAREEFLVIDGQQRLTTVSLLFLAMHNLMQTQALISKDRNLSLKIYEEYLIDKFQDDETRIKLKPVKNDREAFGRIFGNPSDHIRGSNLTINFEYFRQRLLKQEVTLDELYDAICRLEIISITLNQDDNPQLIFESLNSTGLALSEGDKIRNYMLMGLPSKHQTQAYERYWNPIEVCTGYDVSAFVRDYLSMKQQMTPSLSRVFFSFKAYVEDNQLDTDTLLQDLLDYAKRYQMLLIANTPSKALNACIFRLNRLETTVTRPYFLEVLRLWQENTLSLEELLEVFLVAESYLFRRVICDLPTNTLNKIFLLLHKEILRYDGTPENYLEKYKHALLNKKERARFPADAEFVQALGTRQIYMMNAKNKVYLLERIENHDTKEGKDVYRHVDEGNYSIEHIMPQHLTPTWINSLGSDYELIHEQWLHRLANLTLTAYNTKYSNAPFSEKKHMHNGYLLSGIRMNQIIARNDSWGLRELEERDEALRGLALNIWATPETGYSPPVKQLDSCTLAEDFDLGGRLIARFEYSGTEQPVTSWTDMVERVLKILHQEDKSVLTMLAFAYGTADGISGYISQAANKLRSPSQIDQDVFIEKDLPTATKLVLLRRLFDLYGADPEDLVFFLRGESKDSDQGAQGKRHAIRKQFWAFALEQIREANSANGSFANVNPSSSNWINGYYGINGVNTCCVANFDGARVELYIGRSKKHENKAIFDALQSQRAAIEAQLGAKLTWYRGDNNIASKIYIEMPGVSIVRQDDWLQMADFMAKWSSNFYDAFVTHLRRIWP